jgi:3-dehydroquinate dehydratase-1
MIAKKCLPIMQSRQSAVIKSIINAQETHDIFEVWLDLVEDFEISHLDKFIEVSGGELIILFRRPELEAIQLSREVRDLVIKRLAGTNSFLDLDMATQEDDLEVVLRTSPPLKIILSYHNYHFTPSDDELLKVIERMEQSRGTILKIATFCRSENDSLRLLTLLLKLQREGKRSVVCGMGPHGIVTRIFGTLWGNEFVFLPENQHEASASGQLTRIQMETIFNILHNG